ncbi:protein FAM228A [Leuresthes tenuis]|uniref:protein FAM228A n=1 Tax=Leuresthes tenuis TaxID=355514 RepID=UPI003B50F96F
MAELKGATESRGSLSQPSVRMRNTQPCARPGKRNKASSPCWHKHNFKHGQLSHTPLRQLQAKMEAEDQQAQEKIQHFLDTENGFMKELEFFLRQRDEVELRRRELLHKHWTEHVWFPLEKRVKEYVSRWGPVEAERRRILYNHYLHQCDSKMKTDNMKDTSYRHLLKEKRTSLSGEAGCKHTRKKARELSQEYRPFSNYVPSQVNQLQQASSHRPVSAYIKIPVKDRTEKKKSGRLDTLPRHITATAASDGRCHQTSCWFSRCKCHQQPASLHQLSWPLPMSK